MACLIPREAKEKLNDALQLHYTVAVRRHVTMIRYFQFKTDRLDAGGATASLLCAIHCALMPFVVTLLPLVGLSFLASEAAEWVLVALSALFGVSSLCLGFRQHRSRRALAVLAVGLALLATGRIIEHLDLSRFGVPLLVLGGVTIAASHAFNHFLCRACRVCKSHDQHDFDADKPRADKPQRGSL